MSISIYLGGLNIFKVYYSKMTWFPKNVTQINTRLFMTHCISSAKKSSTEVEVRWWPDQPTFDIFCRFCENLVYLSFRNMLEKLIGSDELETYRRISSKAPLYPHPFSLSLIMELTLSKFESMFHPRPRHRRRRLLVPHMQTSRLVP